MSIVIISIIYFFCGTALSVFLDIIISEEDPAKKSTIKLTAEIAGIFGIIGVAYYGMRHFIKYMPFPLDGIYNFKYKLLKIEYYENYTLYTREVALFRSTDYYINIFTYEQY